jgi:MFS transporter, DHA1 family, multidrug resistance protein
MTFMMTELAQAVPLVYPVFYDFSATSTALVFLTTAVAIPIAFTIQTLYLIHKVLPKLRNGTFGELENFLVSGIAGSPLMPIGLFIFGTYSPRGHQCLEHFRHPTPKSR